MGKLRRISLIALCVYLAATALSFLSAPEPQLSQASPATTSEGIEVSGQVVYEREGWGGFVTATGTATYSVQTGKVRYSSREMLAGIRSGEVPHGEIAWEVDWLAFVWSYLSTWLVVGAIYWFVTKPEPVPGPPPREGT
jgi:hypothetical protein